MHTSKDHCKNIAFIDSFVSDGDMVPYYQLHKLSQQKQVKLCSRMVVPSRYSAHSPKHVQILFSSIVIHVLHMSVMKQGWILKHQFHRRRNIPPTDPEMLFFWPSLKLLWMTRWNTKCMYVALWIIRITGIAVARTYYTNKTSKPRYIMENYFVLTLYSGANLSTESNRRESTSILGDSMA